MFTKTCDYCSIAWVWNDGKKIFQTLKLLSVNERFISRTLAHYWETDDVVDWQREGYPRSVCTRQTIHVVCEWVKQNPVCKQKRLAVKMNISKHSLESYFAGRLTPRHIKALCESFIKDGRRVSPSYDHLWRKIHRWRWVVLSVGFCVCSPSEKNVKMVARARPKFHRSGWL